LVLGSLLLLASTVFGGTSLTTLYGQVTTRTNMFSDGDRLTSLAMIRDALNRGIVETCRKYPAVERYDTMYVRDTGYAPLLASDFDRLHAAVRISGRTLRVPLTVIEHVDLMSEMFPTLEANKQDRITANATINLMSPRHCYTFAGRFNEHPKFSLAGRTDSVEIMYYAIGGLLSAAGDTAQVSPSYVERVIDYACSIIAGQRGDAERAAYYLAMFESGMNPTKNREEEGKK